MGRVGWDLPAGPESGQQPGGLRRTLRAPRFSWYPLAPGSPAPAPIPSRRVAPVIRSYGNHGDGADRDTALTRRRGRSTMPQLQMVSIRWNHLSRRKRRSTAFAATVDRAVILRLRVPLARVRSDRLGPPPSASSWCRQGNRILIRAPHLAISLPFHRRDTENAEVRRESLRLRKLKMRLPGTGRCGFKIS